jgi:hypothetical protein
MQVGRRSLALVGRQPRHNARAGAFRCPIDEISDGYDERHRGLTFATDKLEGQQTQKQH